MRFRVVLVLRMLALTVGIGAVLFAAAGRLDLPFVWGYLAAIAGAGLTVALTVPVDLLEERLTPAERGRDDLGLLRRIAGTVFLSQLVIAGLDVGRLHLSDGVPAWLAAIGLAGMVAVWAVWYWAMRSNPFFSAAVRIQHDRGHRVVSTGPYRFVRHPGYATFVLLGWGGPAALGSWSAVALHLVIVVLFVRRTVLEDRMLREELRGYAAYAERVRYRFVPGVW